VASRRKGRIIAFQALYSWEATKTPLAQLLSFDWLDAEKQAALDEPIAAFARLLVSGTIERLEDIDGLIKRHLKNWDFSRLNRVDLAILRMSVFSLLNQDDVPPSIVIDEAIDISKEFGTDDSYRFVNGVLDGIRKTIINEGASRS
jgi:N utilization substance protein B